MIPAAQELWNNEIHSLTDTWANMPSKLIHENMVANWVGEVGSVADLGCGIGRYAAALKGQFKAYHGYDITAPMIQAARATYDTVPEVSFSLVDIFSFQVNTHYDVVLMIDVAQHQKDPMTAVERMLQLWNADRYIFSMLIGDHKEELLHSTVVPISWAANALREYWGVRLLRNSVVLVQEEAFMSLFMEVEKC